MVASFSSEVLQEVRTVNFIVLDLGRAGYYTVAAEDVIEGALFTKHVSGLEVAEYQVLLLDRIVEVRLYKNVRHLVRGVEKLAQAAVDEVNVVAVLVEFLNLEALSHLLLQKEHFKIFNHALRKVSESWNITDQKVNFFLGLRDLGFVDDRVELLSLELDQQGFFCRNLGVVKSAFIIEFLFTIKGRFINGLAVLEVVAGFRKDVKLASKQEPEGVTRVALLIQIFVFVELAQFGIDHHLKSSDEQNGN